MSPRKHLWLILALTVLVAASAVPARAVGVSATGLPAPTPELSLPSALALLPDTLAVRTAGVWYNNYSRAARAYNVSGTVGISGAAGINSTSVGTYFQAILPLRPGAETGVTDAVNGRWSQQYGYNLFQITGEVYSNSGGFAVCDKPPGSPGGGSNYPLAVTVGNLDATAIDRVLGARNYLATRTAGSPGVLFVRKPVLLNVNARGAIMNALLPGARRIIFGARPCDVGKAAALIAGGTATLAQDPGYARLAAALGPVQGAYVAANVVPPPFALTLFPPPPGGHLGPALHSFGLYAVAYQEPRRGEQYLELGLVYARAADALADIPTLQARLRRETLSIYGAPWRRLATLTSPVVQGNVLVLRLRLAPATPRTLWQDVVAEHALSLLSR